MGAGILPPNATKRDDLPTLRTRAMALSPNNPPNETNSPASLPGTGMTRTAVVLPLIMPMAISSAMMAYRVAASTDPGRATISNPTEHTLVMASNFSKPSVSSRTALASA